MRPIWTGTLSFGLVTIPVKLYAASESSHQIHFRLLNTDTMRPIKEIRVDPKTGKEVPWDKITRGVEYKKGRFVSISEDELKSLPLPTANTIEIFGFAEASEIDPLFLDKAYYLSPGQGGGHAYEVFRQTLQRKGKVALGKVAFRNREHVVAIRPGANALVMLTLYYADEVRKPSDVVDLPQKIKIQSNEERMAGQLIDSMEIDFHPEEYHSNYKDALEALVQSKIEGKALPRPRAGAKVIDLQEALRESLKRAQSRRRDHRRRAAS